MSGPSRQPSLVVYRYRRTSIEARVLAHVWTTREGVEVYHRADPHRSVLVTDRGFRLRAGDVRNGRRYEGVYLVRAEKLRRRGR